MIAVMRKALLSVKSKLKVSVFLCVLEFDCFFLVTLQRFCVGFDNTLGSFELLSILSPVHLNQQHLYLYNGRQCQTSNYTC